MNCPYCIQKGYQVEVFSAGSLHRCIRCTRDVERQVVRVPILLSKKGKVILCTIHGRTGLEGVDKLLFAVGKPKGYTYFQWWEWKPGLAPSRDLVTFTKEHNRRGHLEGWFDRYTESLLEEWENRQDFMNDFSQLLSWLREGKTVAIACYCDSRKRLQCHLSILGDLVSDLGYSVVEAQPIDY